MSVLPANPSLRHLKTPPFLLFGAVSFWGWQSGFLIPGLIMGALLELRPFVPFRWDPSVEDFRRVWNFCTLLALAMVVYVFAANEEGGGLNGLIHNSSLDTTRHVGISANTFLRWLPMTFFLFMAAQQYAESESVPPSAISVFMRRKQRLNNARELHLNISYPYFVICLFSAGIHTNDGTHTYYWGQVILFAWALWPLRSPRFSNAAWLGTMLVVVALGFLGQRALNELQRVVSGYNARWLSSFLQQQTDPTQSFTAIGQLGKLKLSPRIVIRLEAKNGGAPPTYLREASYRTYVSHNASWSSGGGQNEFSSVGADRDTGETAWTLRPNSPGEKTNRSTVTIAAYLNGHSRETGYPEGLLPLPPATSHLDNLPVYTLRTNQTGATLGLGLGLVIFNAQYNAPATFDSGPMGGTNNSDFNVPTNELPALQSVAAQLHLTNATTEQKIAAVQEFFSRFEYTTWQKPAAAELKVNKTIANPTPLSRFLLQTHAGHCEFFATATVLLLRELGLPARYAVGYYVHERAGRGYVVRERDAHAWCLTWNEARQTWENLDTTPPSWIGVEENRASPVQWLSDVWSWLRYQIAKLWWYQKNFRQYLIWGLIPVLLFLLYQLVFRRDRKRRKRIKAGKNAAPVFWPGLDSEFYLLERKLAARGVARETGEALSHWLTRILTDPLLAPVREPIQEILRLHYRHRFDPQGLQAHERAALRQYVQAALAHLAQMQKRPRAAARSS